MWNAVSLFAGADGGGGGAAASVIPHREIITLRKRLLLVERAGISNGVNGACFPLRLYGCGEGGGKSSRQSWPIFIGVRPCLFGNLAGDFLDRHHTLLIQHARCFNAAIAAFRPAIDEAPFYRLAVLQ